MSDPTGELLPDRVLYKWITDPDQRADHDGQTLLSRSRAVISRWAQARGAQPATGVGKVDIQDGGATIRFDFPGLGRLKPMSWADWFRVFEQENLVFVFEDQTQEGLPSHTYRLVRMDDLENYGAGGPPSAREPVKRWVESPTTQAHGETRTQRRRSTGWRRALKPFRRLASIAR